MKDLFTGFWISSAVLDRNRTSMNFQFIVHKLHLPEFKKMSIHFLNRIRHVNCLWPSWGTLPVEAFGNNRTDNLELD